MRLAIGRRLVPLAVLAVLAALSLDPSPAIGASYIVDRGDDLPVTTCSAAPNDCTLRGAITSANAGGAGDVITFDPAVTAVALGAALPPLAGGNDTVDGGGNVTIDANGEAPTFACVTLSSPGNVIKGLAFTDCSTAVLLGSAASDNNTIGPGSTMFDNVTGVHISSASAVGNSIVGNKIGTNAAGNAIPPEGANTTGVLIAGVGNTVGGTTASTRNVISGNVRGLWLTGDSNTAIGNYVGTDVNGTVDLGNTAGFEINGSSNTVGGPAPGQGNLVSGNDSNLAISGGVGSIVSGNSLGPDANGSATLTSGSGVTIQAAASGNTIGPRNTISDNTTGVLIDGAGTSNNVIKGNYIGTNAGGGAIPNSNGVTIQSSAQSNTVGGTGAGDGNVIAYNSPGDGVQVNGAATTGNAVRRNSIHANGGLEINNVAGGNLELPPPILLASDGTSATGIACPNCAVDIFSDAAVDARVYEGSTTAAADGAFNFSKAVPLVGPQLTATNTDAAANTSELSAALLIDSDGDGYPDLVDDDDDNDGNGDATDPCRVFPEDFDGFEDADGCPEPDNDRDGICDAGQSSPSCSGSDTGKYSWTDSTPGATDCRNVPEDLDSFHDDDGCPEPDNDVDGFPDVADDCPGSDYTAGADGIADSGDEPDDPLPTLTREDYDGVIDTDGCHDSPGDDWDGDGLSDEDEVFILGTDPQNADTDADGARDGPDNCRLLANPGQENADATLNAAGATHFGLPLPADPLGDACDSDDDNDGFSDAVELAIGTNPLDNCPGAPGPGGDAWPLDNNQSGIASVADVFVYRGRIPHVVDATHPKRLDLNDSGILNISDVFFYKGRIPSFCS